MLCHGKDADIHKKGLQQMVKAKGGLTKLGLGGFLSHLIILYEPTLRLRELPIDFVCRIDIGDATLNAVSPAFEIMERGQRPETPITLLSALLCQSERTLRANGINMSLISLLKRVHRAILSFEFQPVPEHHQPLHMPSEDELRVDEFEEETPFSAACRYAAYIHLNSLQRGIPFSSDENQALVEQLRSYLSLLPQGDSLEFEKETYVWLCFTGAAVAREKKTWFLAKVGPVVMSLDHSQLDQFKIGVVRFCRLLRKLEEVKNDRRGYEL